MADRFSSIHAFMNRNESQVVYLQILLLETR